MAHRWWLVVSAMVVAALPAVLAVAEPSGSPTDLACRVAPLDEPIVLSDHPLDGAWVHLRDAAITTVCADVFDRAVAADVVFLGEHHDHPEQMRIQKAWIEAFAAAGREPIVAMEIFDVEDQPLLDRWRQDDSRDADALAQAVGMDARGWNWPVYRPIVATALDNAWPLLAINLATRDARTIAMQGYSAVDRVAALDRPGLPLRDDWDEAVASEWLERAWESHCRMIPREHMGGFLLAQRARDAVMAERIESALAAARVDANDSVVVVITGFEHARKDIGAPAYLRPGPAVFSVALREVRDAADTVDDYRLQGFDAAAFTRWIPKPDPCDAFAGR